MSISNSHPKTSLNHSGNGDNIAGNKIVNNYNSINQTELQETLLQYVQDRAPNTLKLTHDINVSPPPIPIKHSKRTSLVESLKLELNNVTLLHVKGEVGTGKTQLCNLIIQEIPQKIFWFRLREYTEQLKTFLAELNNSIEDSQRIWKPKIFSKKLTVPLGSIIVLDDLPSLIENQSEEEIYQLIKTCEKHNIKIISSSNYDLPKSCFQYTKAISNVHVPNFSEDETIELLQTYHAPALVIEHANLINLFCDCHPYLIITTTTYLESQKWEIDFDAFFKDKFIEHELEHFQKMLDNTVKDTEAKELVYRLNSIGRTVTEDDIRLVCSVEPSIMHPFEKINLLLNSWIFKESKDEYLLSPLLYKLGSKNLDPKIEQNVNLVLGIHIFDQETVNPYDIVKGISYLLKAKEFNTAGYRLFQALYSIAENNEVCEKDILSIHTFWAHTTLPSEMDLGIQIFVRTMQIVVHAKFGKETTDLYDDYLRLELKLTESMNEFNFLSLLLSHFMLSKFHFCGAKYAYKTYDTIANMPKEQQEKCGIPNTFNDEPIEVLLFMNIQDITSLEDFSEWISFIKNINTVKLKELFDNKFAVHAIKLLKSNILNQFSSENDTKTVHSLLLDFAQFAYENKIMILWAYLVASTIERLLKENANIIDVNHLLEQALQQTYDSELQLLISNDFAMYCVGQEKYEQALSIYTTLIDMECTPSIGNEVLVDSCVYAAIAFAKIAQNDKAKIYFEKALKLYLSNEIQSEIFLAKIYGEYSILLWNMGLYHECIESCEKILVYIENHLVEEIDEEWKSVAMVLGHIIGYFYPILSGTTAPERTADGGVYAIPSSRFFLYTGKEVSSLFDIEKFFLLYFHMYNFFYIFNDSHKGKYYLHKAFEASKQSTLEDLKILLYKDFYLFNRDYISYFNFVLSLQSKTSHEGMTIFILLSFISLVTQLIEGNNQIEAYKSQFMLVFSGTLEKKYFNAVIDALKKLNHIEDNTNVEKDWVTNRLFLLSDVYNSTTRKALEVHPHIYNDFFSSQSLPISPVIEKEILEKYFFEFWIAKINNYPSHFQYSSFLLTRINEIYLDLRNPKEKVTELLTLISRYKKS